MNVCVWDGGLWPHSPNSSVPLSLTDVLPRPLMTDAAWGCWLLQAGQVCWTVTRSLFLCMFFQLPHVVVYVMH